MNLQTAMQWRSTGLVESDGVIVGASKAYEQFLPWWWINYRLYNAFPVTFISFGMTEKAKDWCRQRGELIQPDIPEDYIAKQADIDPSLKWIKRRPNWVYRTVCMKKPLAMLQTPYKRTLWLDPDCQVRRPLDPLFETCENPAGLGIMQEPDECLADLENRGLRSDEKLYNSGVVSFKRNSSLMRKWVEATVNRNAEFFADQEVLCRLINEEKPPITLIPPTYNWFCSLSINQKAAVLHWVGGKYKMDIFLHIQMLIEIVNFDVDQIDFNLIPDKFE